MILCVWGGRGDELSTSCWDFFKLLLVKNSIFVKMKTIFEGIFDTKKE